MNKKESADARPQREADRRKRQVAALKANLKRRKVPVETVDSQEKDDSQA